MSEDVGRLSQRREGSIDRERLLNKQFEPLFADILRQADALLDDFFDTEEGKLAVVEAKGIVDEVRHYNEGADIRNLPAPTIRLGRAIEKLDILKTLIGRIADRAASLYVPFYDAFREHFREFSKGSPEGKAQEDYFRTISFQLEDAVRARVEDRLFSGETSFLELKEECDRVAKRLHDQFTGHIGQDD